MWGDVGRYGDYLSGEQQRAHRGGVSGGGTMHEGRAAHLVSLLDEGLRLGEAVLQTLGGRQEQVDSAAVPRRRSEHEGRLALGPARARLGALREEHVHGLLVACLG